MNMTEIAIDAIKIDGGTQARVAINEVAVAEYAEAMTEGEMLPPVVVFHDGASYYLADGFHRFHANRRIGARTIAAEVRTGTLADAKLFAYGANQRHGLRRTNEDKRKAVLGVLADAPEWSDRAIARHVGVSNNFVSSLRASICHPMTDAPTTRTVERNGKSYTQDVGGRKKAGAEPAVKHAPAPAPDVGAVQDWTTPTADEPEHQAPPPGPAKRGATSDTMESLRIQLDAAKEEIEILKADMKSTLDDNNAMGLVFDADDKLAEAMKESARLRAEVASLSERVNGLLNEKNQQIRMVKWLRAKLKKAGVE